MKENLLILLAQGLRGGRLGFAGDGQARTPCLDSLASAGLLFRGAVSPRPDRTAFLDSFLTGRLEYRLLTGADASPFADALRRAGYETSFFGPWGAEETPGAEDETERICSFMELAARNGRPFAVFAAFALPGDGEGKRIDPEDLEAFAEVWLRQQPNFGKKRTGVLRPELHRRRGEARNLALRRSYAGVSTLDRRVGEILRALSELGLERETVTVFTSDHGSLCGEHGERGSDFWYAEAIRPPLLISQPMRLPEGIVPFALETVDLMPTLLSLAGVGIPDGTEGRDLTKYIPGGITGQQAAPAPCGTPIPIRGRGGRWQGFATERYTFVRTADGDHLYDRASDPYELNDLAGTPEGESLAEELLDGSRR